MTKAKVRSILRQNRKGVATKEIARDMKVTQRRVQQVLKDSREIDHEPVYGEDVGRPRRPNDDMEAQIVKEAHERYRLGARMLEYVIRKRYMVGISHNRIHMYLKEQGLAQEDIKNRSVGSGFVMKGNIACRPVISRHEWDGTDIKVCRTVSL